MTILLKTAPVRVSSIQIMQVRVQNKGNSVWKSRYVGDVSSCYDLEGIKEKKKNKKKQRDHIDLMESNDFT